MLVRVLLAAIFAGVIAGIFYTGVQSFQVIPLIHEAERYEGDGEAVVHSHSAEQTGDTVVEDSHKKAEWAPADGGERLFYTVLANVMVGVAFALILTAAVLALNQSLSLQSGILWGLAGYFVFVLAPNFGLPAELPGMQAAELVSRQIWWAVTVLLSAVGLGLFAFKKGLIWSLLGLSLILAPHIYGAPQPISHESAVPANLAAEFVMATLTASLFFWVFLGGVLGKLFESAMKKEEATT